MRIIVTGLIAQHHTLAGVTWDYLQYLIGLKKLGHEVYYFEDSGEWPYNVDGGENGNDWIAKDCFKNIDHLNKILTRYGLEEQWAYCFPVTHKWYGMATAKRKLVMQTADLLINVSGTLRKPELYAIVKKKIYIDSDPGFTQVKLQLKLKKFARRVAAHDVHFSFGETLNGSFKESKYNWKPTRSPIVLSEWVPQKNHRNAYTTIMNWISYKPLKYAGKKYNQKDVEFMKFLEMKHKLKKVYFEVAINKLQPDSWKASIEKLIPPDGDKNMLFKKPTDLLSYYGWHIVDPEKQCGNLDSYRNYILHSKAEWSVAKGGYVVSDSGWFSCRSACYLSAGRPVIVQKTGFDKVLPVGEGILQFSTLDESIEAVQHVEEHYNMHSKRAREIAVEYFDSDKILAKLIEDSFSS